MVVVIIMNEGQHACVLRWHFYSDFYKCLLIPTAWVTNTIKSSLLFLSVLKPGVSLTHFNIGSAIEKLKTIEKTNKNII